MEQPAEERAGAAAAPSPPPTNLTDVALGTTPPRPPPQVWEGVDGFVCWGGVGGGRGQVCLE